MDNDQLENVVKNLVAQVQDSLNERIERFLTVNYHGTADF